MSINAQVRWKDTKASPATQTHLNTKLQKIVRFKVVDAARVRAEIAFVETKNLYSVDLTIPLMGFSPILAGYSAPDVLTAINRCVDKALDQLRRIKTKTAGRTKAKTSISDLPTRVIIGDEEDYK